MLRAVSGCVLFVRHGVETSLCTAPVLSRAIQRSLGDISTVRATLAPTFPDEAPGVVSGKCRSQAWKDKSMHASFGINARPASMRWEDLRKGPPLHAVLEHLDRVVRYRHHMQKG